jgi:hypothetical protein
MAEGLDAVFSGGKRVHDGENDRLDPNIGGRKAWTYTSALRKSLSPITRKRLQALHPSEGGGATKPSCDCREGGRVLERGQ